VPSKLHVTTAAVTGQKRDLHKERADALAAEMQAQLTLQVLPPPVPLAPRPLSPWSCS
jgi:hypothetical protein